MANTVTLYVAHEDRRSNLDNRVFVVLSAIQQNRKGVTRAYLTHATRTGLNYLGKIEHITSEADISKLVEDGKSGGNIVHLPEDPTADNLYRAVSLYMLNEMIFDSTQTEPNPVSLAIGDKVLVDPGILDRWSHPPRGKREIKPRAQHGDYCVITGVSKSNDYAVNGNAWYDLDSLIFLGRADYQSLAFAIRMNEVEDE